MMYSSLWFAWVNAGHIYQFIMLRSLCELFAWMIGRFINLLNNLFRSPWSNSYDPPLADGTVPSDKLRKLEIDANSAFDQYREM